MKEDDDDDDDLCIMSNSKSIIRLQEKQSDVFYAIVYTNLHFKSWFKKKRVWKHKHVYSYEVSGHLHAHAAELLCKDNICTCIKQ